MIRGYRRFVTGSWRLLTFGLVTAMLSGFGQTFYIGLFNGELRAAFGLSHSGLGLIYGAATLGGAALLFGVGALYDRLDLRLFLGIAAGLLATGCWLLGSAEGRLGLLVALFLVRLGGQGLMGHIALTTMAQRFHQGRGKAVSIAALGFPLSEAVFPLAAVLALTVQDWRALWMGSAVVVLGVFLPVLLRLLRGAEAGEALPALDKTQGLDWSLGQVLRDRRFALLMPAAIVAPFVITVALFHQVPLALGKGWPTDLVAAGMVLFAAGHVTALISTGPLVDRWSAQRLFVPALLPLAAAMAALALLSAPGAAMLWLGLLGLGLGLCGATLTPLLAEVWGTAHLGAIRSLVQALMILSTAVGPPLLGWLLDLGVGTGTLAGGIAVGILVAAALAWLALARR